MAGAAALLAWYPELRLFERLAAAFAASRSLAARRHAFLLVQACIIQMSCTAWHAMLHSTACRIRHYLLGPPPVAHPLSLPHTHPGRSDPIIPPPTSPARKGGTVGLPTMCGRWAA